MNSKDKTNTTANIEGEDNSDSTAIMEGQTKSTASIQESNRENFVDKENLSAEKLTAENSTEEKITEETITEGNEGDIEEKERESPVNVTKDLQEIEETTNAKNSEFQKEELNKEIQLVPLIGAVKALPSESSTTTHDDLATFGSETTEKKDIKHKINLNIASRVDGCAVNKKRLTKRDLEIAEVPNIVKKNSDLTHENTLNSTVDSSVKYDTKNILGKESAFDDPFALYKAKDRKNATELSDLSPKANDPKSSMKSNDKKTLNANKVSFQLNPITLEPIKIRNENIDIENNGEIQVTSNDDRSKNEEDQECINKGKIDDEIFEYNLKPPTSEDADKENIHPEVSDTEKNGFAKFLGKFLLNMICSIIFIFLFYESVSILTNAYKLERFAVFASYFTLGSVVILYYCADPFLEDNNLTLKEHFLRFGWVLPYLILYLYLGIWWFNGRISLFALMKKL